MEGEAIKDYIYVNDEMINIKDFKPSPRAKPLVYEVVRVYEGNPSFLQDHLERFSNSLLKFSINYSVDYEKIGERILRLVEKSQVKNNNVKLVLFEEEGKYNLLIYFIKSFYPPRDYYEEGVNTILYFHERENPNIKYSAKTFRDKVALELEKNQAFEALLYNKDKEILEGSRSNIFFIKDEKLITAPGHLVLQGITRKHILRAAEEIEMDIVFEPLKLDELKSIDACFMSGTSIGMLPISKIDNYNLNSSKNHQFLKLDKKYTQLLSQYRQR